MEAKEFFTASECLNHKKSSQQLTSCVVATRNSLFCKMFSPCVEQEKTLKNSSRKLYVIKMTKKEEAETKSSVWEKLPKLAQILEQWSGTRQVCVLVFFLFWSLYKTNRFHVAVGLFSITKDVKNEVKTSVTHSPAARVPLLCFYHILTSSLIYYWTDWIDARQHGIYLLNSMKWRYDRRSYNSNLSNWKINPEKLFGLQRDWNQWKPP